MESLFSGTCAVVTGGANGIGQAIARALAEKGVTVAIVDISQEAAAKAAAEIGGNARAYACDVADGAQVDALAARVRDDLGGVNFVFSNAGVFVHAPLHETSAADFDWLFDVNVKGGFNLVRAFMSNLLEQGAQGKPARFVFTGSENSIGLPFQGIMTAYTATKHALLAMTEGLRRDLEGTGVSASIFCPGPVRTKLWDSASHRQDQYGGATVLSADVATMSEMQFANFVDPAVTAAICLDGVAKDECIIITDPALRAYAEKRHTDVGAAFDRLDARLEESKL